MAFAGESFNLFELNKSRKSCTKSYAYASMNYRRKVKDSDTVVNKNGFDHIPIKKRVRYLDDRLDQLFQRTPYSHAWKRWQCSTAYLEGLDDLLPYCS